MTISGRNVGPQDAPSGRKRFTIAGTLSEASADSILLSQTCATVVRGYQPDPKLLEELGTSPSAGVGGGTGCIA